MTDPLRDDRFPDRPQHPDFWRLSQVVTKHDGRTDEGKQHVTEVIRDYIDPDSLLYMCQQRAHIYAQRAGLPPQLVPALFGALIDGILTGIAFEREGGHRDE